MLGSKGVMGVLGVFGDNGESSEVATDFFPTTAAPLEAPLEAPLKEPLELGRPTPALGPALWGGAKARWTAAEPKTSGAIAKASAPQQKKACS